MNYYHHLSAEERASIMLQREQGASIRAIAAHLDRSPSTISRELARNRHLKRSYCATAAAKRYRARRALSIRPRKLSSNSQLCDTVEDYLIDLKWSPEQISGALKCEFPDDEAMHISHEAIYAHIYAHPKGELRKMLVGALRRSKVRRGTRGSKSTSFSSLKIADEQLFVNRPDSVNSRAIAGHWEGDLIVGAMNKSCVGTLVERKTGYVLLCKMDSKNATDVRQGFEKAMKGIPDFIRLSMTYDRGAELSQHPLLSKQLDMKIYFADRNAPWQRGSSENINGLIRQFLPKATDLSIHTQKELDYVAWLLNTRPRKRYGFRSPQWMMENELEGGLVRVALDS